MKVLLGITCYDRKQYILDKFMISLKEIVAYSINDKLDINVLFIDNSKTEDYADLIREKGFKVIRSKWFETTHERLTWAYNVLREEFLKGGYEYLMIIEQDVIAPKDVIRGLMRHNKPIVSGVYYLGKDKNRPCIMVGGVVDVPPGREREFRFEKKMFKYDFIDKEQLKGKELIKVFCCGLGCVLIHGGVLEKLKFRVKKDVSSGEWRGHNDMSFYMDLRQRKIPVFIDPTITCEHYNDAY